LTAKVEMLVTARRSLSCCDEGSYEADGVLEEHDGSYFLV
jgi:hypothetical protein